MTESGDIAIQVEGLSKSYLIGHQAQRADETFREMMTRQVRSGLGGLLNVARGRALVQGDDIEEFWALRDVGFEVKRGEVMGVVGRNGAGKSTLLKVLSRITEPTEGRVKIAGRVASLLEVGTGFHPELTGRENIYLNGAILGMSRTEISAKFDEIVDFAEVERFLDTPVKRYSSGMYVRLAFAVAAHLEPEILIIDEVLAVGDVVFQKKCLGKMQSVAGQGRTVLFVSHNMQTVAGLTERCIFLEGGRVKKVGPSDQIIEAYLADQVGGAASFQQAGGQDEPAITSVTLHTSGPGPLQQYGRPMDIDIEIATPEPITNAALSFQILTSAGQPVVHILNLDSEMEMLRTPGVHRLRATLPQIKLWPGHYRLRLDFGASHPRRVFKSVEDVCAFEVAVLDEVREFYWQPNNAIYVEDVRWSHPPESK